jgi:hypothetical protein
LFKKISSFDFNIYAFLITIIRKFLKVVHFKHDLIQANILLLDDPVLLFYMHLLVSLLFLASESN